MTSLPPFNEAGRRLSAEIFQTGAARRQTHTHTHLWSRTSPQKLA